MHATRRRHVNNERAISSGLVHAVLVLRRQLAANLDDDVKRMPKPNRLRCAKAVFEALMDLFPQRHRFGQHAPASRGEVDNPFTPVFANIEPHEFIALEGPQISSQGRTVHSKHVGKLILRNRTNGREARKNGKLGHLQACGTERFVVRGAEYSRRAAKVEQLHCKAFISIS